MTTTMTTNRAVGRGLTRLAVTAAVVALPLTGCDNILQVNDPDIVTPENLESDIGLQTLRNGALGEFTVAYSGGGSTDAIISTVGLFTDEWMHSGTFTTRFRIEIRSTADDNGTLEGMFRRLQRARNSAEGAAMKIAATPDGGTDPRVSEMNMYAGFTYVAFGENYCNGVPFSKQEGAETVWGPPETNEQALNRAIAAFDAAINHAGVADDVKNASLVGKARAQLDLGLFDAAATTAAMVTDDAFAKVHNHSSNTGGQRNGVFELNVSVGRWSLGDTEGVNGLDFRTANDPRVTSSLCAGCAFDTSQQVPGTPAVGDNWQMTNYTSRNDPVRLATGIEARLIEAEAALQNDAAAWLTILNDLRANWAALAGVVRGDAAGTLDPLTDPGTQAAREDLHFRERAFWLHSTGTRLSDMRRLVRQYGRDANTVYPIGEYWKPGAVYEADLNLIIPLDEENNPEFTGCIDRTA